jgi:hypothetical protein
MYVLDIHEREREREFDIDTRTACVCVCVCVCVCFVIFLLHTRVCMCAYLWVDLKYRSTMCKHVQVLTTKRLTQFRV